MHFVCEIELSVCSCVMFAAVTQSTCCFGYHAASKLPCDAESVIVFQY